MSVFSFDLALRHHLQWRRKLFHIFNGTLGFSIYVYSGLPRPIIFLILGSFVLVSLLVDFSRFVSPKFNHWFCGMFKGFMRIQEAEAVTSGTKGALTSYLLLLFLPYKLGILVILFMAYGDAAGGIIGPLFGKHHLNRHATLEGSLAVLVICALSTWFAFHFVFHDPLTGLPLLSFCLIAGLIGALAEGLFPQWDDNVMMGLLSAPSVWVLMKVFGVS